MVKRNSRKATNAGSAAGLVILIGLLIILYILFIPPADRWKLLENTTSDISNGGIGEESNIILRESPGTLLAEGNIYQRLSLDPIRLYMNEQGVELLKLDSLVVSHSVFSNHPQELIFSTNGLIPGDAYLSFNVLEGKGIMRIILNNHIIAEQEFGEGSNKPVQLPRMYLSQGENKLVLEVSSPGIAFWRLNKYILRDISIVGNLLDISGGKAERSFYISKKDLENIKRVTFSYVLDCDQPVQLSILLNNQLLFYGPATCAKQYNQEIDPAILREGMNTIEFESDNNLYIDIPRIKIEYNEQEYPTYYFEIDEDDLDRSFWLTLKFAEKDERHILKVQINARSFTVDTYRDKYERDISDYIEEGTNSIKIIPERDVNIREIIIEKR
ncbi:hypothetical protein J7K74_03970 [Candidatus Woesearchaeota archaeon]|nr:hypothetical protein [Candidatus Woesearchaeota archaeon]